MQIIQPLKERLANRNSALRKALASSIPLAFFSAAVAAGSAGTLHFAVSIGTMAPMEDGSTAQAISTIFGMVFTTVYALGTIWTMHSRIMSIQPEGRPRTSEYHGILFIFGTVEISTGIGHFATALPLACMATGHLLFAFMEQISNAKPFKKAPAA